MSLDAINKNDKLKTPESTLLKEQVDADTSKLWEDIAQVQLKQLESKTKGEVKEGSTDQTMLTYIGDTEMYKQLKDLESKISWFTVEKFAKDINTTVETYLRQSFNVRWKATPELSVSDKVISSLSIGIQISMMEALTRSKGQAADFFSQFSQIKTGNASSAFSGMANLFGAQWLIGKTLGTVGKANEFVTLAKKVENCIGFVSRYSGEGKELGDGSKVEQLANANKFRLILGNPGWSDDASVVNKTPAEMWFVVSDGPIPDMSPEDKKALKEVIGNVPIKEKTIEAIVKALPTAQSFLEKRSSYKESAIDLMSTVAWFLDVNVFGLGTLWSIIWIQNPMELFHDKEGRKKGGIINLVLKVMWFSDGLEGLYKSYLIQSIDKNMTSDKKLFIKRSLEDYKSAIAGGAYTGPTIMAALSLPAMDPALQAKIPVEYTYMKDALYNNIKGKEASLNIIALQWFWISVPTKQDEKGNIVVDTNTWFVITEDMISTYLNGTTKSLIGNADFMTGIKTPDEFMLALAGWLVCGTCFGWWVALGIENIAKYQYGAEIPPPTTETDNTSFTYKAKDLLDTGLKNCAMTRLEYKIFVQKIMTISQNLGINPEYIMKVIAFETGGSFNPAQRNGLGSGATGLLQFMPGTAINLSTSTSNLAKMSALAQLDYVQKYLEKRISISGKLKTLSDVYLAVFSPAFIGRPSTYVAYYKEEDAYKQNKIFDVNNDGKMTVGEIVDTVNQKTKDFSFFEKAPIPAPAVEKRPETPIQAKRMEDINILWDSHAGWLAQWLSKNVLIQSVDANKKNKYYDGFASGDLLEVVRKRKEEIQKKPSLLLVVGANDISKKTIKNLESNLKSIQQTIAPTQLVLSTLQYYPLDNTEVSRAEVDEVNTIIRNFVAKESSCALIDTNQLIFSNTDFQQDKRHLLPQGYRRIADTIYEKVTWKKRVH